MVQTRTYCITYQASTPSRQVHYEDMQHAFQTLRIFILKWGNLGIKGEDYDAICQQALEEIQQRDFQASWNVLTLGARAFSDVCLEEKRSPKRKLVVMVQSLRDAALVAQRGAYETTQAFFLLSAGDPLLRTPKAAMPFSGERLEPEATIIPYSVLALLAERLDAIRHQRRATSVECSL